MALFKRRLLRHLSGRGAASVRKQTNQTVQGGRLRTVGTMVPLEQVLVQVDRLGEMSMRLAKLPIRVSFVVEIELYGVEFRTCIRCLLLWSIELAVASELAAVKAQPYTIDSNTL
jgi:hypothetical protein